MKAPMFKKSGSENKTPYYYVGKRLRQNKPAMVSLVFIIVAIIVALLGYIIMPDNTPLANDGAVQIAKQPPGFSCTFLKTRKNIHQYGRSFLHNALYGKESAYTLEPIESYKLQDYTIMAVPYGSTQAREFDLVATTLPLYVGRSQKLNAQADRYVINGNQVRYLDLDEQVQQTTLQELTATFEQDNIENRYYLLGTDQAGRDLLSRLMYGARISLSIGFMAVIIALLLGVSLGAIAGFFGGITDRVITWFMSVVWSIPGIMLVIAISLALQSRGLWVAFLAVGLTMWVDIARVVRGQILSLKEKAFVEAARSFGFGNFRIIFKHILPNMIGPLIVIATANFAAAILLEAGLSFLGLGVQPPTPSWGTMIDEGRYLIGTPAGWYLILPPALSICLMVLAFNLLGNGLRDAFDPKTLLK